MDGQTDGRTDGVTALLDLLSPSATQVKIKQVIIKEKSTGTQKVRYCTKTYSTVKLKCYFRKTTPTPRSKTVNSQVL